MKTEHEEKNRWIVGHDFSPCSDAALFEAARLLEPLRGKLHLFHVLEPLGLAAGERTTEVAEQRERASRERLDRLAAIVRERHPKLSVHVDVIDGDPVAGILAESERTGADHIVVGTHGRTGLAHALMGSVAERVVREAKLPVLVMKAPGATNGNGSA